MLDIGFLRCKPLLTNTGRIINFNYDQMCDRYGYSISDDGGKTYTRHYGAKKVPTPFDESMAYQMQDGTIRMFARTSVGGVAEARSRDGGMTWEGEAKVNGIVNPNTRLYVGRTPSGRVLLVNNDDNRQRINMTVYLSEDDGSTAWLITTEEYAQLTAWLNEGTLAWDEHLVELPATGSENLVCVIYLPS
jgi:hypothetical protein